MAIRCSYCKREYDHTLFDFKKSITCVCGQTVKLQHEQLTDEAILLEKSEEQKVREIRGMADRISFLIITGDYPMIDIEIEKQKLRKRISDLFPDRDELYDLVYESRFRRLAEQFRDL